MATPTNLPELLSRLTAYCSAQERAPWHVQQKLRQWGIAPDLAAQVLPLLIEKGYVDEARFCRVFARSRHSRLGWGPVKVRAALWALALPEELINAALAAELPPQAVQATQRKLSQRKLAQLGDHTPLQQRARLARYLQQKGYSAGPLPDAD